LYKKRGKKKQLKKQSSFYGKGTGQNENPADRLIDYKKLKNWSKNERVKE